MKVRQHAPAGALPAVLGRGPVSDRLDDVAAWQTAGREWSAAHGLGVNGWLRLVDPEVRWRVSVRRRLAELDRPAKADAASRGARGSTLRA